MQTDTWIITGRRSNGELLYYVADATQGMRWVPNAQSLAYVWVKRDVVLCEVENMACQYKGLAVALEPLS